jgi:hypothetical protein
MDDDLQRAGLFDGAGTGPFLLWSLRPSLDPLDGLASRHDFCCCWGAGAPIDGGFVNCVTNTMI